MTIILFLVDTSASMNQRTYLGITLLDMTKGAVETFMKMRSRDPNSRWDRYMLLTFEDPPANVKAGWKESHTTFIRELKNLEASGLTTTGPAIKNTLDLLNINRMQSGIDTYGQGRCPFFLEPAIIICMTDGRKMTGQAGVQHGLNLPMNNIVPGSELTKEPFRWDQRLFGVVLRVPAVPPPIENQQTFIPSAEDAAIDAMCDVTGGRSYAISSQRMLMQCLESLVQKCLSGVVINFEKIGPDPPPLNDDNEKNGEDKKQQQAFQNTAWQNCRKLIYVQRSAQKGYFGHWPIPEAFWPDLNSPSLPPRSAHPVIRFSCTPCDPMVIENLAFDKYELEPSPLTQYILERRQPNTAWQVFVSNSAKYSDIGHPFGYLKASTNLSSVNLFVMPYNYPALLPLLDELFKVHKLKPTQKWRQQFDNYLKTMPVYYAAPLRRALGRMQVQNLVPEQMDSCLSYSVVSYLKKLKNKAKEEYDRLVSSVGQKVIYNDGIKVTSRSQTSILQRKDFHQLLQHYGGDMSHLKQELTDFNTFKLAVPDRNIKVQSFKNPFDIPRRNLVDQLSRMRMNFLHPTTCGCRLQDEENLHSIPVQDMGSYQEYLKRMPQPLREIETQPVRQHTFGNPFKVNKNIMIDEADEAMPGQQTGRKRSSGDTPPASPRPNKRKPGPLPKDVPARQLMSPTPEEEPVSPPTPEPLQSPKDGYFNFGSKSTGLDDNFDLSNGEDLEIVMINRDAETTDIENGDSLHENTKTSPITNHVNHQEPSPIITAMKEKSALEYNAKLRKLLVKEVKKPGKNYENIFSQLNNLQGNLDAKCLFLRSITMEAARFKKRSLIKQLKDFEMSVIKSEQKKSNSSIKNNCKSPSR